MPIIAFPNQSELSTLVRDWASTVSLPHDVYLLLDVTKAGRSWLKSSQWITSSSASPTCNARSTGTPRCSASSRYVSKQHGGPATVPSPPSASRATRSSISSAGDVDHHARNLDHFCVVVTPQSMGEVRRSADFDIVRDPDFALFGARGMADGLYIRDPGRQRDRVARLSRRLTDAAIA